MVYAIARWYKLQKILYFCILSTVSIIKLIYSRGKNGGEAQVNKHERKHLTTSTLSVSRLARRPRLLLSFRLLAGQLRENDGEDVAVVVDKVDLQSLRDEAGQVVKVLAVLGRQQYAVDTDPPGGDHLLLDAADGQHFARQRHLARHGDVLPHRLVHGQRQKGRHDRTAGARSVFRRSSLQNNRD